MHFLLIQSQSPGYAYIINGEVIMKKTTGKTAYITGSASGIGPGIAKAFISACMHVVIADLRKNHIDEAMAFFKSTAQMDKVVISPTPL